MKRFLQEYGYLTIMAFCLVCCGVLLVSVVTDQPLISVSQPHVPVLRTGQDSQREHLLPAGEGITGEEDSQQTYQQGCLVTEQYLEGQLAGFLPENFPAEKLDISFEGGLLGVALEINRSDLKDYLKDQGVELGLKRTILLQLLPRKVALCAAFVVSADSQGLHLSPVNLLVGDKELSLSGLPESAFSAVDQGINALLKKAGASFQSAEFTPEGLLLK